MRSFVVAFIVGSAGCSMRLVDPCAGAAGTCLAIQVDSSVAVKELDQLTIVLSGDGVDTHRTVGNGRAQTLPVAIGVLFDSLPQQSVSLTVAVSASRGGQVNGFGTAAIQLISGQHQTVHVRLDSVVVDGRDAGVDDMSIEDARPDMARSMAPHLIAPLSTSTVTSQQPTFKWSLPAGGTDVEVDICRDRACTNKLMAALTVDASALWATPTAPLPPGVLFWRVSATVRGARQTSPIWEFWVGSRTALKANTSFGTVLDVNGDGYADVIVGATKAKDAAGNQQAGRAYLYLGSPSGLSTMPQLLDGRDRAGGHFGASVASAGDVNGDGYADVIVGASGATDASGNMSAGRAYLYLGGPGGLGTSPQLLDGRDGENALFGTSVASAGDVNGDGYADVIVGAYQATNTAGEASAGRAYLYFGGPDGLLNSQLLDSHDGAGAFFGFWVAGAGDINGDGYADVIVGAYKAKDTAGNASAGRAYLYSGGPGGLGTDPQLLDGLDGAGALFGAEAACAGDVNGDGYADVLVGAQFATDANGNAAAGRAYLYFGSPSGLGTMPQLLDGPDGTRALFGVSVAGAGDVNGDGYADVIVGAFHASDSAGHAAAGRAHLYLGGPSGLGASPQLLYGMDGGGANFGVSVSSAGDVNGDGYADFLVGAWVASDAAGDVHAGRAYLYLGSSDSGGIGLMPHLLDGRDGGEAWFGNSVASAAVRRMSTSRLRHHGRPTLKCRARSADEVPSNSG